MNATTFQYGEYSGSAEISIEDGCLYGRILHIHDLVSYEAQTVDGLRDAFIAAVQHYLNTCASDGFVPDIPDPSRTESATPPGI